MKTKERFQIECVEAESAQEFLDAALECISFRYHDVIPAHDIPPLCSGLMFLDYKEKTGKLIQCGIRLGSPDNGLSEDGRRYYRKLVCGNVTEIRETLLEMMDDEIIKAELKLRSVS